eukprot:3578056-Rhodomonas_salina.1
MHMPPVFMHIPQRSYMCRAVPSAHAYAAQCSVLMHTPHMTANVNTEGMFSEEVPRVPKAPRSSVQ